ncbi:MAG: DUF1972 domain-containing protein, partial [Pseudomonadota bacterium]
MSVGLVKISRLVRTDRSRPGRVLDDRPHVRILGTRGIPAAHGGFEVFAEHLSQYLVSRGWRITVYCQDESADAIHETSWNGVRRLHIPAPDTALGSVIFDFRAVLHALGEPGLAYTLGYNTAIFNALFRVRGVSNLINMDGFEWRRSKWSKPVKAWLRVNERAACAVANILVADNPAIGEYLKSLGVSDERINVAAYGSRAVADADATLVEALGLTPGGYALVVARPEPENSILEIVRAFGRADVGARLVVLGKYEPESNDYHRAVRDAAGANVMFPGAIFEPERIDALRRHCRLYIHGHQVGGTNPSLVEALGAGSPVLAQDNAFNRWVAGAAGRFFGDEEQCAAEIRALLDAD